MQSRKRERIPEIAVMHMFSAPCPPIRAPMYVDNWKHPFLMASTISIVRSSQQLETSVPPAALSSGIDATPQENGSRDSSLILVKGVRGKEYQGPMTEQIPRLTVLPGLLFGEFRGPASVLMAHGVPEENDPRDLVLDVGVVLELRKSTSYNGGSLARHRILRQLVQGDDRGFTHLYPPARITESGHLSWAIVKRPFASSIAPCVVPPGRRFAGNPAV